VSDQTPKGRIGVRLITNHEHNVQNVLAQTERCPHHNSIKKGGLLESNCTSTSLGPKVGHNYLCQKQVHRTKGTNTDLRVGLLLWSSAKEIQEIVHARCLNTIWERNPWNRKHWNPDHNIDELWVNLNGVSSDNSLHNQASVVILSDNHMTIEFPHQSRKSRACTVVEVLPLILINHLANRE
jgi:selenocysteine lyase/cysteine desulfurase